MLTATRGTASRTFDKRRKDATHGYHDAFVRECVNVYYSANMHHINAPLPTPPNASSVGVKQAQLSSRSLLTP